MAVTQYLCIGCPLGCRLEVEDEDDRILEVRGSECNRGKVFAEQEHTSPERIVTTTVRVAGGVWPRLPVKTLRAVPKARMQAVSAALRAIEVTAPVRVGAIVVADVADTGVPVVATRDMPAAERPDGWH